MRRRWPSARVRQWLLAVLVAGTWGGATVAAKEFEPEPLRVAILDFEDRAGFQGEWHLARDVPDLLAVYVAAESGIEVIARSRIAAAQTAAGRRRSQLERAAEVGRQLQADVAITGVVEKCGVRRVQMGDPNLGGYKSYTAQVIIDEVTLVRVATGKVLATLEVARDSTERPLGLNLFGRPGRQDREFRELFEVGFASERFFELPLGGVVTDALAALSADIARALVERPPLDLSSDRAVVLAVEGKLVYLGIGVEDNVEHGDLLSLLHAGERVALVRVDQLIGAHLCRARVLERTAPIEAGARIGARLSPAGASD